MSYGYDIYGRPIMPPQPNPQYQNHIMTLENKIKDLESRMHGNQSQATYSQTGSGFGSSIFGQGVSQTITPPITLIPVASEDEAWASVADFTGAKQYYKNESKKEIYVKWFDANVPATIKETYRLVEPVSELSTEPKKEGKSDVAEIMSQLSYMETEIIEVKKIISEISDTVKKDDSKDRDTKGRYVKKEDKS